MKHNVTLYWLTGTITSSMEVYWHNRNSPSALWRGKVDVPSRLFLTTEQVDLIPETAAREIFSNLWYGRAPTGGHFLAAEEPQMPADDFATFFRTYR